MLKVGRYYACIKEKTESLNMPSNIFVTTLFTDTTRRQSFNYYNIPSYNDRIYTNYDYQEPKFEINRIYVCTDDNILFDEINMKYIRVSHSCEECFIELDKSLIAYDEIKTLISAKAKKGINILIMPYEYSMGEITKYNCQLRTINTDRYLFSYIMNVFASKNNFIGDTPLDAVKGLVNHIRLNSMKKHNNDLKGENRMRGQLIYKKNSDEGISFNTTVFRR